MNKLSKQEEIEKLKQVLIEKVKSENDSRYANLLPDEIMKIIIESSNKGKYVFWVLREYLKGNIQRFEDVEARCKQALILFKNNLSKFTEQQKQLNKLSFQELENLVSPYQDVLTQNEIKRMNKEKIWSEIETIYEGPEGKIYSPKTKEASIFLGQGTKWCTAATGSTNIFNYYNKDGPLYIFITNDKDGMGREVKYQLHFESTQFMNMQDEPTDMNIFNKKTRLFDILIENLSMKQKIKHSLGTNYDFCVSFGFSNDLNHALFREKIRISLNLKKIPDEYMTYELCKLAVQQNGYDLRCVPIEMRKKELCELAVRQNGYALDHVPEEFKTEELYKLAVKQNGRILNDIPTELITQELCELAMRDDGRALEYVPTELKTKELCELAVGQNGSALSYVPKGLLVKKLCELAVRQNGNALCHVPTELKTKELCELAVGQNGSALSYAPKGLLVKKLCELAVRQNGDALRYVPVELKTKELCELAVGQNGNALYSVPLKFRTKELCELAMKQDINALDYVPKEFKTRELLETYIKEKSNRNNINYSFEEILEIVFSVENNQIKEIFGDIKTHLQQYYIELKSEQLFLDFDLTEKHAV